MTFSGKGEALRIGDAGSQAIGHAALLLFSGSVLWGGRERGMKPELLSGTASLLLLTSEQGSPGRHSHDGAQTVTRSADDQERQIISKEMVFVFRKNEVSCLLHSRG